MDHRITEIKVEIRFDNSMSNAASRLRKAVLVHLKSFDVFAEEISALAHWTCSLRFFKDGIETTFRDHDLDSIRVGFELPVLKEDLMKQILDTVHEYCRRLVRKVPQTRKMPFTKRDINKLNKLLEQKKGKEIVQKLRDLDTSLTEYLEML